MNYFTSNAYIVTSTISGRHGRYGATTSIIGIFNTENRAVAAKKVFTEKWNKDHNIHKANQSHIGYNVKIVKMQVCQIDEQILSEVYE